MAVQVCGGWFPSTGFHRAGPQPVDGCAGAPTHARQESATTMRSDVREALQVLPKAELDEPRFELPVGPLDGTDGNPQCFPPVVAAQKPES